MTPWKQLIDIALLGTDKRKLDVRGFPPPIHSFIDLRHTDDQELRFLETAAMTCFYEDAGRVLATYKGTWNEEVITETRTLAQAAYQELLHRIRLEDQPLKGHLLEAWLQQLIDYNEVINGDIITTLLTEGNHLSTEVKDKIVSVIGNRGKWALASTSIYNYSKVLLTEKAWQEGNFTERKAFFSQLRKSTPEVAMTMLASTWNTESVVNKKGFLELLLASSIGSDLPFIEACYAEFAWQAKEKKTERECRRLTAMLLLRHTSSALYIQTYEALHSYFVPTKKGLGNWISGKANITLQLPETDDVFWNAQHMMEAYGIETKNIDSARFPVDTLFWMSFFIEVLPPTAWTSLFQQEAAASLDTLLRDKRFQVLIEGKQVAVFLPALLQNMEDFNDPSLGALMVDHVPSVEAIPLLSILTPAAFENFILRHQLLADSDLLAAGPQGSYVWSLLFSEKVLHAVAERFNQGTLHGFAIGRIIARRADVRVLDTLLQLQNKMKDGNPVPFDTWNKAIFIPVNNALDIRRQIINYKKA